MTTYSNVNIYHTNSFNYYRNRAINYQILITPIENVLKKLFSSRKSNFHRTTAVNRDLCGFRCFDVNFQYNPRQVLSNEAIEFKKELFKLPVHSLSYLIFVVVGKYENRLCSVCAMKYGKVVRLPDEYLSWRAYEKTR